MEEAIKKFIKENLSIRAAYEDTERLRACGVTDERLLDIALFFGAEKISETKVWVKGD